MKATGRPRDYVQRPARGAAGAIPGHDLLLPAGRHHQPDPEFRRAGADRRAGPRPQSRRRTRPMRRSCCAGCAMFPASPTRACSSRSTIPASMSTSTAPAPQYVGVTETRRDQQLVVNLAGSSQIAPAFWLNPENGVSYPIVMQTPQYQIEFARRAGEHADHRRRRGASQMLGAHRRHSARDARPRGGFAIRHPAH